jgi:hypothetical protein
MARGTVVEMMGFAGMRAMGITFIGAGGKVGTTWDPALSAQITKGTTTVAQAVAAGTVVFKAAR